MISTMRHAIVDSWIGRVLAITVFAAFVGWGIGDVALFMSSETDVAARVGQHRIAEKELAMFLRSELPTIAQRMGVQDPSQIPPMLRQQIAYQILQRLVSRVDILEQARKSGVVVPDTALRDEIFSLPYFHNAQGDFDRGAFDQQIAAQGLTERQVLDMVRDDLAARAVLQPLARSGYVPQTIVRQIAVYDGTIKKVNIAYILFDQQKTSNISDENVLQRYYKNHPWQFMIPQYRKAQIAVLSQKTVEPAITLSQDQYKNFYEAQEGHFHQPQTRDVQFVIEPNKEKAQEFATQWRQKNNWSLIKKDAGGAAADMSHVRPSAIALPDLRDLIFHASSGEIKGPVQISSGWAVFNVSAVNAPRNISLEDAKAEILSQYKTAAAASIAMEKQRAFQDAIVGGGMKAAAQIPGAYVTSVDIDPSGLTHRGENVTLPVSDGLKNAIISRIFQSKVGDTPSLEDGGDNTFYAVQVDSATQSRLSLFADARQHVVSAWQSDQQQWMANKVATELYRHFPNPGQFHQAGVRILRDRSFSPSSMNADISPVVRGFITRGHTGDVSMARDDKAFVVAQIEGINLPSFDAISRFSNQIDTDLQQRAGNDLVVTYLQLLAKRFNPHVNNAAIERSLSVAGFGDSSQ